MNITKSSFGITNDGEEAFLYRLENTSGAYVTITSFGCRVVNICVPDKTGTLRDVCLGYDTLAEYEKDQASFGAVVLTPCIGHAHCQCARITFFSVR